MYLQTYKRANILPVVSDHYVCVRRGAQQLCLKIFSSYWDRTVHRQRDIPYHQEGCVLSPTPKHSESSERPTQNTKWMQKQFVRIFVLNLTVHLALAKYQHFVPIICVVTLTKSHTANILMLSAEWPVFIITFSPACSACVSCSIIQFIWS